MTMRRRGALPGSLGAITGRLRLGRRLLVALLFVLLSNGAIGQVLHPEQGRPYHVERFAPQFRWHTQNWAVTQDARGVIYVAERSGLLEYDGSTWRGIALPGQLARSLATDQAGRVYVGGVGEIGYLAPDSVGRVGYRSLLPHVREGERDFADVWTVIGTEDGVYFQTYDRILRWDGEHVRTWQASTRFHKGFAVHGKYYVRQDDVGLMVITGDHLALAPRGEEFAGERIDAMLPLGEAVLLVTRSRGLLVWQRGETRPFPTEADDYLRRERVYHGVALSDSAYALTTFSGKVVLIDREGRVLRVLGRDVGLEPDDLVLFAYPDHQGGSGWPSTRGCSGQTRLRR